MFVEAQILDAPSVSAADSFEAFRAVSRYYSVHMNGPRDLCRNTGQGYRLPTFSWEIRHRLRPSLTDAGVHCRPGPPLHYSGRLSENGQLEKKPGSMSTETAAHPTKHWSQCRFSLPHAAESHVAGFVPPRYCGLSKSIASV